jgi:hypothetical protein
MFIKKRKQLPLDDGKLFCPVFGTNQVQDGDMKRFL